MIDKMKEQQKWKDSKADGASGVIQLLPTRRKKPSFFPESRRERMACMTMQLTVASCISGHSCSVLANYGSTPNKRKISAYPRRDQQEGLGIPTRRFLRKESNSSSFGNVGHSGRSSGFTVYSGAAEKVGFTGGGGDSGGGGTGGDGGGGDDFSENSRDDSSQGFGSGLWIWSVYLTERALIIL